MNTIESVIGPQDVQFDENNDGIVEYGVNRYLLELEELRDNMVGVRINKYDPIQIGELFGKNIRIPRYTHVYTVSNNLVHVHEANSMSVLATKEMMSEGFNFYIAYRNEWKL